MLGCPNAHFGGVINIRNLSLSQSIRSKMIYHDLSMFDLLGEQWVIITLIILLLKNAISAWWLIPFCK